MEQNNIKNNSLINNLLIYRIPSLLLWYWIIGVLIYETIGITIIGKSIYLIIPPVVSMLLISYHNGIFDVAIFFAYVFFFPIWAPTYIFFYTLWQLIKLMSLPLNIVEEAMNEKPLIYSIIIFILSWGLFIFVGIESKILISSIMVATTLIFILQLFKFAADPYLPLYYITNLALYLYEKFHHFDVHTSKNSKNEEIDNKIQKLMNNEFTLIKELIDILINKLNISSLLPLILVAVFQVILLFSFNYSINLFFLSQSNINLFSNINSNTTFFDCFYFIFCTILNNPPGSIEPSNYIGKFLMMLYITTGVMTLSLFITLLTSSIYSKDSNSLKELAKTSDKLKQIDTKIIQKFLELKNSLGEKNIDIPKQLDVNQDNVENLKT